MNVRQASTGLIDTLRGLDLLAPEQLAQLVEEFARRELSGRELGQFLLQRKWLTAFQVNHFLQGKGQNLLLGPYVLIDRLGSGGMGEVFKARHRRLHRLSAVKVLSRAQLDNPISRERFLREAEAAAHLSHPNIVAVHDAGVEGERPYLALELIDGLDLGRLLAQSGPLPIALACDFTRQASLGLHHAHERGYVHRDIKPQNLLVAPQGGMKRAEGFRGLAGACVKVLDMGLVRHQRAHCTEETELALTQHGVVIGTIDYVAPEQARNAHQVDRRADLYSLGCTLYHLLTGQPPFAGGQALDKLLRHQSEPAPPLEQRRPDAPAALCRILSRLMAKDPNVRYQTALELIHDLANLASGKHALPVLIEAATDDVRVGGSFEPTQTIEVPDTNPEMKPRPRRWWPLIAGGVAAVLVLAVGISALVGRPSAKPPTPKKQVEKPPAAARPVADHLAHYVPPDTALVIGVNPQAVLTAPILRAPRQESAVSLPLDPGAVRVMKALALDPADVEWFRFTYPSSEPGEAAWLVRTRDNAPDFGRAPGHGMEAIDHGGHRVWKQPGLLQPTLYYGRAGPYVVIGPGADRVATFLDQARGGRSDLTHIDANLREAYLGAEKKSDLWLAVAPAKLGKTAPRDGIDNAVLTDVLTRCRAIGGHASVGRTLTVDLTFHAHDEQAAQELTSRFAGYRGTATWQLSFLPPKEHPRRLWLRFLQSARIQRDGSTVRVHSTVRPEAMK